MESADREPGDNGHGIEMALLPLKRASNDSSSCRGSSPDDSYSSPAKKRRVDGSAGADDESKDAGGHEAPVVPRQRRPAPAPDAVAAAAKAKALSAAEKLLKKCKWVAAAQQAASPVATQPPAKKFMHDGIRSFAHFNERHDAEAAAAVAREYDEKNQSVGGAARPRDDDGAPDYADADHLGEALRRRLAELGATRPRFLYQKTLQKSDVCPNQNRLLVSCKRETLEGCPITPCFSPAEWQRVENKEVGLMVTALDRDGVPYAMTCKFLDSNAGYRLIAGWKFFLQRNGIQLDGRGRWTRDVDVELLVFRSRALQRQPQLDENRKPVVKKENEQGKKKENEFVQVPHHLHPDGSLGLILLHHEHRRRHAEHDDDYDEGLARAPPVAREKGKKQRDKRDAASPRVASPVARAGPGAEPSEGGPSKTISKVEMVDKYGESRSNAMIGLIMLRGANSNESKDNVEGGANSKEGHDNVDVKGEHGA